MKKKINVVIATIIVALSILGTGCRNQLVTVKVNPADANIIANGVAYNKMSPFFIEASTGRELAITAYKDGYQDQIYVINYSLSTLGKIEACTSFLVLPLIGLCFDTAWRLEENNITLTLEPLDQNANSAVKSENSSSVK